MALPPPLPSARRGATPPPLPSRSPAPFHGVVPLLPSERQGVFSFDPNATARSDRDIQRASGQTYNVWISFNSTNVNRAKFEPQYDMDGKATGSGTIYIEFLDLSLYEYDNRSAADWLDLIESSSKGRFVYYHVRDNWPFTKLRGPQRTVTAAMRAAREPVTRRQAQRTYKQGGRTVTWRRR